MKINEVLQRKGSDVATVEAKTTVAQVLDRLAERDVGALVVVGSDGVVGIVSERDVVRQLQRRGVDVLGVTAGEVMTQLVSTCSGDDTVDQAMRTMTDQRIRHLPVVEAGGLVGIVSIGDVVKSRIDELQTTTDQLEHYINGT